MTDKDKIERKISQINQRIFELNDKIDATITTSEMNKIEKIRKKLVREKTKLFNKLYDVSSEPLNEDEE